MKKTVIIREITEKKTKTASPYLLLTLFDKEKVFQGKIWNMDIPSFPRKVGEVIEISYETSTYNGQEDIILSGCRPSNESPKEFIPRIPEEPEELYNQIVELAQDLRAPLKEIVTKIYEDFKEVILTQPAAKTVHHNVSGGILLHVYKMLEGAMGLDGIYDGIDMDMVYAGIMLHDIGKVKELSMDDCGNISYTAQGTLFGHMPLGFVLVHEYGVKLDTNEEDLNILLHIVLAHQGTPEMGSSVIPCTPEAYMVHMLDMLDSRVYQYNSILNNLEPGEHTAGPIKTLAGARVYKRR